MESPLTLSTVDTSKSTNIQTFNNQTFGSVRIISENGKPLFCGSDVAKALGYSNPSKALNDHCKGITKRYTPTKGGKQELSFIPEGDLYRLIASSKLESAQKFESWVFDEVLPSIRQNGGYIQGQETLSDTELMAKALLVAQNVLAQKDALIKQKETQIIEMKPDADYGKTVQLDEKTMFTMDKVATHLHLPYGRNTLIHNLRFMKILKTDNQPYQEYILKGITSVIKTTDHGNYNVPIANAKGEKYILQQLTSYNLLDKKAA